MSRQEIHITFNPASSSEGQFSFSPERAVLNGDTSAVDVILETEGQTGAKARFSKTEGIFWHTDGPADLEQTLNPGRTVLTLRGFPRIDGQEDIDYGYKVHVEYKGSTFSSEAEYPVMSCVQTGGGGGG